MTNDTNTLNGALQELGETMAANLTTQGVSSSYSEGLTTLASKILQIQGGGTLTSSLTLTVDSDSVTVGDSIVLTSTLTATYDGANVDLLNGLVSGATITYYNGNTVIGTSQTNANGVATFTYTTVASGTLTISAVFSATDIFEADTSNSVTVTVNATPTVASVDLTGSSTGSSNSILSQADGDTLTLSATAYDSSSVGVEGVTIEFFNGSTSMGTAVTDSSGVATCGTTYTSQGSGDITFTATELSTSSSSTYNVSDIFKYDDASTDKTSTYNTLNTALTFDTDHYISTSETTSDASDYMAFITVDNLPTLTDFTIECDLKQTTTSANVFGLNYIDALTIVSSSQKTVELASFNGGYGTKGIVIRNNGFNGNNRVNGILSANTWYHFKLTIEGTSITALITQNGSTIYSKTITDSVVDYLNEISIYQADGANTIHWKNLEIKPV